MRGALLLFAACSVPASQYSSTPAQPPPPPETPPEWNVRASENLQSGPAYADRIKAAPRRAPTDEVAVIVQADTMDFFRKSIAHDDIHRDLKLAVDQAVSAKQHPTLRLEDGGAPHENMDWYE